jgi:hypothetical protein
MKFENFFADLGECPPDYSLERIDVNGNYEPSNCKWIPRLEQYDNRRRTRMVEIDGVRLPFMKWAKKVGIHKATIHHRELRGWSERDAFLTPVHGIRPT